MYRVTISDSEVLSNSIYRWPLVVHIPYAIGENMTPASDIARGQIIEVAIGEEVRRYHIVQDHRLRRPSILTSREAIAKPHEWDPYA